MTLLILISISVVFTSIIMGYMRLQKFGRKPTGKRLLRIKGSPNYRDGAFQNLSHTPALTEGTSYGSVIKEFFFTKRPARKPVKRLPSMKADLIGIDRNVDMLVWFGHSSYYFQADGKRYLVDPVFSGSASPLAFTTKAFEGTDVYTTDDIPQVDTLIITHDHWDHLDHQTLIRLIPKIGRVICGLGTGAHLEHWGYDPSLITEMDWNESLEMDGGILVHALPARHFSGRGFVRNRALWMSYAVITPSLRIYVGGDSGYDAHFTDIGKKHGPFDLAILENGQYDKSWKYIHMMPDEVLQAARDLRARRVLPVHSAKFALANHSWDEPLRTIYALNAGQDLSLITPLIGEVVQLREMDQRFRPWWEGLA